MPARTSSGSVANRLDEAAGDAGTGAGEASVPGAEPCEGSGIWRRRLVPAHRGSNRYVEAMSRMTTAEAIRIADLARLELAPGEAERLAAELEAILGYVASLDAVDTSGVEPTVHVIPVATPLRDDVPVAPLDPVRAVANAPERDGTAFVVPKVLDEDEA